MSDHAEKNTTMALADLLTTVAPGWHPEPWTWNDEARDIRARLCLCCGKPGHHQEKIEALVAANGLDAVCIGDDGKLHDGHHRVIAAIALDIERIPLETRAEADARWRHDHGTHISELRRFGDIPPGEHWDWVQKVRQEARDFVKWESDHADVIRDGLRCQAYIVTDTYYRADDPALASLVALADGAAELRQDILGHRTNAEAWKQSCKEAEEEVARLNHDAAAWEDAHRVAEERVARLREALALAREFVDRRHDGTDRSRLLLSLIDAALAAPTKEDTDE